MRMKLAKGIELCFVLTPVAKLEFGRHRTSLL